MIRLCGRDHRYSIDDRENFQRESGHLRNGPHVFLQTCNRVEIYRGEGDIPHDVARHLFRVVCGLESRLIGERHIQGQVRRAYSEAVVNQMASAGLHRLFQTALRIGKTVRNETGISLGAVSYSSAVIHLLKQELTCLADTRVLVVGINRTTQAVIRCLKKTGCESISIANRSLEKASITGEEYGCASLGLGDLAAALSVHDVVVTATSSERPLIVPRMIPRGRPLLIIDLAVPRDVDPEIRTFPWIRLFNVSDVESCIEQNLAMRRNAIEEAERIIEEEVKAITSCRRMETAIC